MGRSLSLGKIFGIPFSLNYTWFIIFFLVTISLAMGLFPSQYLWPEAQYWIVALITSLLFFGSVLAHELSHSVISQARGTPVKGITLFIFGGVSQISREATHPQDELVMAAAGPISSFVLAGVFWLIAASAGAINEPLMAAASWLSSVNLILGVFNLVPGFPLDGGRVLRSIIWWVTGNFHQATRIATMAGHGIAYALIFGGIFGVFQPWEILGFQVGGIGGLWLAFIGWFLDNAADSSYRQTVILESLQGVQVKDIMTQEYNVVPPSLTVAELFHGQILQTGRRSFLVTEDGHLAGIVTLHNIKEIPRGQWETVTMAQAMTPVGRLKVAHPDESAASVLERLDEEDINQLPVVDDGHVVGLVGREHLLRLVRTRTELRA